MLITFQVPAQHSKTFLLIFNNFKVKKYATRNFSTRDRKERIEHLEKSEILSKFYEALCCTCAKFEDNKREGGGKRKDFLAREGWSESCLLLRGRPHRSADCWKNPLSFISEKCRRTRDQLSRAVFFHTLARKGNCKIKKRNISIPKLG
ncbi:hypothetical protein CEXT_808671 [Caerostris extrusa]|uniref:Uncharacterized protein n=1 Tax=Caerostris extrusa TaxID=172846 RepID=A0AAV4Y5J1_CAEEX|nr:hypothetical protein CEXT_808671 [Caerostris extrusa]